MIGKIARYIVEHCYVIFVIFLVLAVGCGLLSFRVKINHDIYSYMPEDSETSQALDIMKNEFDYGETSAWKMMFEDLTEDERAEIKTYIENVENIKSVAYENTDEYVKEQDGHTYALYDIVLNAPADSETANKTYNKIYDSLKNKYTFYQVGEVYLNNGAVLSVWITAGAIACAMVILILMSESFIEPFLYLFAIMVAVLLNKGTNIMFADVSHVTDSISMILQMALSMDYAIMLSSRYRQEKNSLKKPNNRLAMERALKYSFGAICSSSVTTVVGLLILIFMSFTVGRDMGLVLSKGVALSLVSIFTILPALLLMFDKWIRKTSKKVLKIKTDFLGRWEFKLRKLVLPIFVAIFILAFILKGNTDILYTASQNDKIKDVFPEVNQTVVVYRNELEKKVEEFCEKFAGEKNVKRILCFSNTIGEPEKYDAIVAKANELNEIKISGQATLPHDKVETENYLVKVIYYYYYRGEQNAMSLPEFVKFVQNEVMTSEYFNDEIDAGMRSDIERLAKLIIPEEAEKKRSKSEIAAVLEISQKEMDDLYTLYLAKYQTGVRLTLYNFANFVRREVLTNSEYAGLISAENRYNLEKLLIFSNASQTNVKKDAGELAGIFGLEKSQVEQLLTYYNYTVSAKPTVAVSPANLAEFALENEMVREKLGISAETAERIVEISQRVIAEVKPYVEEVPELKEALEILNKEYTFEDYKKLADKIESMSEVVKEKAEEINEEYGLGLDLTNFPTIDLSLPMENLRQVYQVYQMETLEKKLTIAEFVDFLIDNAKDERISLTDEKLVQLKLVKYVIDNQKTLYNADGLARAFALDLKQLELVYGLYDYRYVTRDPYLSLRNVIDFLTDEVFTDADFAGRFSADKKDKIWTVSNLMRMARAGTKLNYNETYVALSPLSGDVDRDQIFLLYLYHGSLYDYDENYTMTIEKFVEFLDEKIITDERFLARIDDEMSNEIVDAKTRVADAKKMLVGEKHSRVLIETELPSEGKETFGFLQSIKDELGDGSKADYFLAGDSAVAYEMSLTFASEMDFITILTMIAIFAVVALTFKSILLPLVLVLIIQTAVYINMAYLSLTGQSILFLAMIIVQSILMGATIDYAILFTSYYLEQRKNNLSIKDALVASYSKSIHSILTSASILIIVTAIVGNFAAAIAAKICQSIAGGTLVSTLIILLLLPAILATLDRFIVKRR